jgi:hypothetical protein
MSKPIHILITATEDGESVAYEKWVSEEELKELKEKHIETRPSK